MYKMEFNVIFRENDQRTLNETTNGTIEISYFLNEELVSNLLGHWIKIYSTHNNPLCSRYSTNTVSSWHLPLSIRSLLHHPVLFGVCPSAVTHGRRSSKTGRTSFVCSDFPFSIQSTLHQQLQPYLAFIFCANPLEMLIIPPWNPNQNKNTSANMGRKHSLSKRNTNQTTRFQNLVFPQHRTLLKFPFFGATFCSHKGCSRQRHRNRFHEEQRRDDGRG